MITGRLVQYKPGEWEPGMPLYHPPRQATNARAGAWPRRFMFEVLEPHECPGEPGDCSMAGSEPASWPEPRVSHGLGPE